MVSGENDKMGMVIGGILLLFVVYAIVPRLLIDWFHLGAFKKGRLQNAIAFTFDDGPDPFYTPRVLDLLKKYDIKASFFVVGARAEKYPNLILRMHQEGHLIGIHNYKHLVNCLMTPARAQKQMELAANVVENITGERPLFYRPPWGLPTLHNLLSHKPFHLVLWSLMVGDWRNRGGEKKIVRRLLTHVSDGDVIVLHDCGETFGANRDAPAHMLAALDVVLQEVKARGFHCVRVDEMMNLEKKSSARKLSRFKLTLVSLWLKWERLFRKIFHIQPLDPQNRFFSVRVRTYHGETIRLKDGEEICRGDRIVELHLDNELLYRMGVDARSTVQLAIHLIRATEKVLPEVVKFIFSNPQFRNVKGIYGVSLINRGPEQFGFTVLDIPKGLFSSFTRLYLRLLLSVIHPDGVKRLKLKTNLLVPKIIAMSTKELIRRYSV